MSVALGKFVKGLEELKKEVKVPNIEEAKQEALKEIEGFPDYERKISAIIIEKTMGKELNDGISQIQSFFASSTNKPVETIDKLIAEINHGRELLQHQYTPVAPLESQPKSQEVSTVEAVPEGDFKSLRRELGEVSYNIISELRKSGVKEIGYKDVYDGLPEDLKKVFRPESFDTSSGIFNGFKKALGKKEIRRISKGGSGNVAKYEVIETQAASKESEIIEEHPQSEITYSSIGKEIRTIIRDIKSGVLFSNNHIRSSLSPESKKYYEGKPEYLSTEIFRKLQNAEKSGEIEKVKKGTYRRLVGERIEEEKEPSSEERSTEIGKRTYRINDEVLGIIEGFDSKENFGPKKIIDNLSPKAKKYYEGKEEYLGKKVSESVIKAAKNGIVEKLGYGSYRKIAKSRESQAEYVETIKKIEKGKEITTKDIYESLPPEIKEKYPVYENDATIYMLFKLTKKARELNLIEETGKMERSKKIFRRV